MVSDGGIRHSFTFVGGGNISTIGGIVRTIIQIANHLAEQGHEVRYLAKLRPGEAPFYDVHKDVIIEPIDYPYSNAQIPAFSQRLSHLKTDVLVVALSGKLALNVMKAAEGLPFPIVRSEHGNPKSLLQDVWNNDEVARAVTFELADYGHLLYSDFADEPELGEAIKSTMKIIPSPVELKVERANPSKPSKDGKFKIVYSGRIDKFEKNSGLLLYSFLQLASEFPDWECHFLGDGELREELQEVSSTHSNGNQVFFHGSVEENVLFRHLTSANLFVIPSDSEGCPIALGEALAHGLPAIGFADCEGVNRMIKHQENGLLAGHSKVPPTIISNRGFEEINAQAPDFESQQKQEPLKDIPYEEALKQEVRAYLLEDSMRVLMSSPELRDKYGKLSPQSVLDYDRKKVLAQWNDFLVGIVHKNLKIEVQRSCRIEAYPSLSNSSEEAQEAIYRLNSNKKINKLWNLFK